MLQAEPKMKSKKSQMEIMGLALVVILISLGLLFAVKFSALNPGTSGARKTYTTTIKAANLLNTILKTNTECSGDASVTQLIQDCASTKQMQCLDDDDFLVSSCDYVETVIETIFQGTLFVWGSTEEDFYFEIKKGSEDVIDPIGNQCDGAKESKNQPIPIPGGLVTVTLELCG